jgi:hypothetical protein
MRDLTDPYDPALNRVSVNQDQAAKAMWELVGAVERAAKSDDKLTAEEVFVLAIKDGKDAVEKIVMFVRDPVPLGEDVANVAWLFQNQLKPFRPTPEE